MLKRNCRTLLTVSVIAAVIAGVITAIWWHHRHYNDGEIVHRTDGTVTAEPTDGTVTAEPTEGTVTAEPTEGTVTAEPTDGTVTAEPTDGTLFAEPTDETEERFPLDDQYASSYREATSNYERVEVTIQFTEKWRQEAELCFYRICEFAYHEDLKQAIIAGQSAWENTYQIRLKEKFAYLSYVYRAGTIVPILHSKYAYDLQRERAIELYKMYKNVSYVWNIFQKYGPLEYGPLDY